LRAATDALMEELSGRDGIGDVTNNLEAAMPFISVDVDRQAAAEAGLSESAVGSLVNSTMQPAEAGTVEIDEQSLTVYVATEDPPSTLAELRSLEIPTASGVIELRDIATVEESTSPASITTVEGLRTATITVPPAT